MQLRKTLFAIALFLSPALAFAHGGHDHSGLLAGVAHPITGLDHLLAMLAVGLWAAQQSGAARWALPGRGWPRSASWCIRRSGWPWWAFCRRFTSGPAGAGRWARC